MANLEYQFKLFFPYIFNSTDQLPGYINEWLSLQRVKYMASKLPPEDYNLVHNILELYNVLIQTRLTTSKTKRDI